MITSKDLAKLCNVSQGTVDRALNDRPGINAGTKKLILETALKYNYVKNHNASSLSLGKSSLIGVVMLNLNNEFFTQMLTSMEKKAREKGYSTVIMLSGGSEEAERQCVRQLSEMHTAGVILCSVIRGPEYAEYLKTVHKAAVSVGNRIDGSIPFIGIDDYKAMYDGTEYVLRCGYSRLYYASPVLSKAAYQNVYAQARRRDGFEDAAKKHGMEDYVVLDNGEKYRDTIGRLKQNPPAEKTAVICSSDHYTLRCVKLFENSGIGVMGFDNPSTLQLLYPQLSTIRYPVDVIGSEAVEALLGGGREDRIFEHEIIKGETI